MRHLALTGLLVCLMAVPSARAQELVTPEAACTYVGAAFDEAIYAFAANQQAEAFVTEVMSVVRLPRNFTVQAANVPRIAAIRDGDRRLILYNTYVLQQARQPGPARWAALRELAHAAGHHLLHHDLGTGPQRPLEELEADDFSGYVLARLRATPPRPSPGWTPHGRSPRTSILPGRFAWKPFARGCKKEPPRRLTTSASLKVPRHRRVIHRPRPLLLPAPLPIRLL